MLNRLRFALAVIRHGHAALDRSDLTGFKVKRVTAGVDSVTVTLTARSIYATRLAVVSDPALGGAAGGV
jgi:hypothetical protein